jgi:16S rRNA (uracil1498-N3)-methyltransferase
MGRRGTVRKQMTRPVVIEMQAPVDYIHNMSQPTPKTRLFVDTDIGTGAVVSPTSDQQHYLTTVMRLGDGDSVAVFNGRDGEWLSQIAMTGRRSCDLVVGEQTRPQVASPDLWLLFAPVKKARLDFIAQKASEMGCSRIWPVRTDYTQVSRVNDDRMLANAIEAAEQTERLDVADVMDYTPLPAALSALDSSRTLIFCDEAVAGASQHNAVDVLAAAGPIASAAILIGPEGGFSADERSLLQKHENSLKVSLGPRILRADTAAIAAVTCFQSVCGDWTV